MSLLDTFKIDQWWKAVLLVGVAICAVTLIFNIVLLNPKHLFGLGLGLILVGFAYFIAQAHAYIPDYGGYWHHVITKHSTLSKIILLIGIVLVIVFFVMILIELLLQ